MSEPAAHTARTLVALHGNFASAAWWSALLEAPPAGWQVLAPDLPGFAGSAMDGEPSIPGYAAWLRGWLDERGVQRPVLLGHSLGGAVALEYAAHHGPVAGLVLAASAPLGGLVTPEEHYPVLEMMRSNPALLDMSLGALFPSGRPANFAQLVEDGGRMAPTHYSGNARALATWGVDPASLAGVRVLVVGGALDTLISPEQVQAQAGALGTSATVLDGLGHGFPQEDPEGFGVLLQAFLDSLPLPNSLPNER
ncbi:alpha/beta fold hydrolase [Deinococcus hohokamensis]|uniref:Alpha/beta fold hydrolase n=1 Tax=Deinococcus hohokamensis TaxID=309883 RepID=A0ABV9I715_9DEIO